MIFSLSLFAQTASVSSKDAAKKAISGLEVINKDYKVKYKCDMTIKEKSLMDADGNPCVVSEISYEYLVELFKKIAARKDIPFKYPEDGCYARAHEMAMMLEDEGVIAAKVFIEGDLKVVTANSPKGYVEWWYHVAPVVKVMSAGKEVVYVIDPSIYDRPVPVDEWFAIQTKESKTSKVTYFNERFHYTPGDKKTKLTAYKESDVTSGKEKLRNYLEIQEARLKGIK